MIFVTLGTQKFQFDRLIYKLEELASKGFISEPIIAQVGNFKYNVKHIELYSFLTTMEINNYMKRANIIITHGGTGSIISAIKQKKKPIVVPRQKKYKEHVDDHQMEITKLFNEKNLIVPVYNIEDLLPSIYNIDNNMIFYPFDNGVKISEDIKMYINKIYK